MNEWKRTTLGAIADLSIGRTPDRKNPDYWTTDTTHPFCTIADMPGRSWTVNPTREGVTDVAIKDRKVKLAPAGSLLMSFKLTIGRVGFAERDVYPNEAIVRIDPHDRSAVDDRYLAAWLESHDLTENAPRAVKGKTLNSKSLALIPVALPPLPVQEQIVGVIAALDDQIAALDSEARTLHAVLRRIRAELVNDQNAQAVRADEAFEITMGRQRAPKYATGPYMTPYLRSANVGYGTLDLTDVFEMNFDPNERKVFSLVPGDVLVSEGSASQSAVGMPAMWRGELPDPICFQKTLLRYRAIAGVSIPAFVNHWCLWAYESGTFLDIAGGTNIKHITAMRAVRMRVCLPNTADQERIAAELDSISGTVAALRCEANHLRSVRSRVLAGLLDRTIDIEPAKLGV
ncbi:restriction endonuclease subunit S [Rhodococcus sp. NPDC003382]